MPIIRKLSLDEVKALDNPTKGLRKLIEVEYDTILGEYAIGDYGVAELAPEEKRLTVRNRLKAAANRQNVALEFRRTKGTHLRFRVVDAPISTVAASAPAAVTQVESSSISTSKPGRKPKSASEPTPAPVVAVSTPEPSAPKKKGRPKKATAV
ncbi:MAG: hypothetical protein SH847_05095 [Roseiflexaceae bacterium]|nr:hypothetical protein [Roseiflexaceae bacterium]